MPTLTSPLRILVVDDEALVARAFCRILRHHDVEVACDARQGRALMACGSFDVVVVDLNLGDASGEELVRHASAPVRVLMSGAPPAGDLARRVRSGELGWLDKPFRVGDLHALIEHACATVRAA